MESKPDAYAHLRAESPWRGSPPVVIPILIVTTELAVRGELSSPATVGCYIVSGISFLILLVSWFQIGSGDGYQIAVETERATGGRRVVTHAALALAMLVVGLAMIAAWVVSMAGPSLRTEDSVGAILSSFSLPAIGFFLAMFGEQRPWDLRVDERESHAA